VDEQTIDEIIQGLFVSLVVDGNAYLRLWRTESGKLVGFSYVPHWEVECERNTTTGEVKAWRYVARNGNQVPLQPDEILHVKYGGPDPNNRYMAMSAVKAVTTELELDPRTRRYLNGLFKAPWASGIIAPGSDDVSWTKDDVSVIRAKLREEVSGESAGGALVLSKKATYEKLGLSPSDMDVSSISENVEARIAAAIGVSPMLLQLPVGLKHSTYSNYEEAKKAATENVLAPLWSVLGRVFTKLYREMGIGDKVMVAFDLKAVLALQENVNDLHERTREDFKANIIDQETALVESGRTPAKGSRGVYSWQLQPVRGATLPDTAKRIRRSVEDSI
jgi:HK97 family phage portal protein